MSARFVPFSDGRSAFHDFREVRLRSGRGELPLVFSQCLKFIFLWGAITKHQHKLPGGFAFVGPNIYPGLGTTRYFPIGREWLLPDHF